MSDRRHIPAGSREEAQMAESVLYGLLWGLLMATERLIREQFNYLGADISTTEEGERTGVYYDGLTIHMASGDYEVTIRRAG